MNSKSIFQKLHKNYQIKKHFKKFKILKIYLILIYHNLLHILKMLIISCK